ncbi:hypothetical protein ANME2D_02295 [Candidatus Methanoperedens nitroreducens]|uniref:Polyhydroxyalkanoate synthesis regulator phasin n=1 Tax=Candidatus Methanoperedens nitratireducens TaxID=1392998 RepID=A0A062V853_9EURY|nr:hypothetical protein [Candidatus Methanoperedens nitroreducens]KCZ71560.1 hypothetical protein ANME2D_02295 [Candidatus Methanoperedens nitroreducens]MDJ1421187.1 hypothetical protein [Candidatus Methanoperedens sp.]
MSGRSDILRKMGLFGIGVISMTQEKIEEFTQEMIKRGEMNQEEGRAFVRQVLSEKDKQIADIEARVNEAVRDMIKRSGVVARADLEVLERRIEELERSTVKRASLEALEKRIEVLDRTSVMRVDLDILERRIVELEEAIRSMAK